MWPPFHFSSSMRVALSLVAIGVCLFLIQASARFGVSRMLTRYALVTNSVDAAETAVEIAPSDPEAHRARATILTSQQPSEAAKSLASAAALRYRDDYLWIELGNMREDAGDTAGALEALNEAVRWAPYYAHTYWQRGNLLLRMGNTDEAFADLRTAAHANPKYLPNLIDLAWGMSRGDLKSTEALLDIKDDSQRLSLIRFLANKGKAQEVGAEMKLLSSPLSAESKNELVRSLFAAKSFVEAFELYRTPEMHEPWIVNGGFEEPLVVNDAGFGWIITSQEKVRLALDVSEKIAGARSLQISFAGGPATNAPLLSQTLIVQPDTAYRLSCSFQTKDIVTGAPPIVTFTDAATGNAIASSQPFPTANTPWATLNADFQTSPTTRAVVIRLQRTNCGSSSCPIFGTLWLDDFQIKQTATRR